MEIEVPNVDFPFNTQENFTGMADSEFFLLFLRKITQGSCNFALSTEVFFLKSQIFIELLQKTCLAIYLDLHLLYTGKLFSTLRRINEMFYKK